MEVNLPDILENLDFSGLLPMTVIFRVPLQKFQNKHVNSRVKACFKTSNDVLILRTFLRYKVRILRENNLFFYRNLEYSSLNTNRTLKGLYQDISLITLIYF